MARGRTLVGIRNPFQDERKRTGLTWEQLAGLWGISESMIRKLGTDVLTWVRPETALSIERGSRGAISYEDIGRWAKAHAKVRLRAAA